MDFGKRFCQNLFLSVCEGDWFLDLGDIPVCKLIIQFFIPLLDHITSPIYFFSSNLLRFSKKIISWSNLVENLTFSLCEKFFGFFPSHQVKYEYTLIFSIIHENFSLESIHGPDVTART